jgi:hypothetical protein
MEQMFSMQLWNGIVPKEKTLLTYPASVVLYSVFQPLYALPISCFWFDFTNRKSGSKLKSE